MSKEDVDILRALLATQTLGSRIKARASVDAATWFATGGPEAETFSTPLTMAVRTHCSGYG